MKAFAKVVFTIGISMLFIAVAGLEGDFTLGQGITVGLIGGIASLSTMKYTEWFFE